MLLKSTFGHNIGTRTIIDKRKMGWNTTIIDTENLSKRLIGRQIVQDMGALTVDDDAKGLGSITLSLDDITAFLENTLKMSKDQIVRKWSGATLGVDIDDLLKDAEKVSTSKGIQFWLAYILNKLDFTRALNPEKIANSVQDTWHLRPTTGELVGYLLVNTLTVKLFDKTDKEIDELNDVIKGAKLSNVSLKGVAKRIWKIWTQTVSEINKKKNNLLVQASAWEALQIKLMDEGTSYMPEDIDDSQVEQIQSYSSVFIDHMYGGLEANDSHWSETFAWSFHQALQSELTSESSWLTAVDSMSFASAILEAEDHVGRYIDGNTLGDNYIHRHIKPRVASYVYNSFDPTYMDSEGHKGTLEREPDLGAKVSDIMNELRTVIDARDLIDRVLPKTNGRSTQGTIVNYTGTDLTGSLYKDAISLAIQLILLVGPQDIDFAPNQQPLYLVDVPDNLTKIVTGAEATEEGWTSLDNPMDVIMVCFPTGKPDFDGVVKHPHPYYAGKDEDNTVEGGLDDIIFDLTELSSTNTFEGLTLKNYDQTPTKPLDGSFHRILRAGTMSTLLTKNDYATEDLLREFERLTYFLDAESIGPVYAAELMTKLIHFSAKWTYTWVTSKMGHQTGFVKISFPTTPAGINILADNVLLTMTAVLTLIDKSVAAKFQALKEKLQLLAPIETLRLKRASFGITSKGDK